MVKPKFGHRDAEVESLIIEPAHSLSLFSDAGVKRMRTSAMATMVGKQYLTLDTAKTASSAPPDL